MCMAAEEEEEEEEEEVFLGGQLDTKETRCFRRAEHKSIDYRQAEEEEKEERY